MGGLVYSNRCGVETERRRASCLESSSDWDIVITGLRGEEKAL